MFAPADAERTALFGYFRGGYDVISASDFWEIDRLEDSVWRMDRLMPVEAHFITAFLARYVKDEVGKAAFIDGLVSGSNACAWRDAPVGCYPGYRPGEPAASVWTGFQPTCHTGLMFKA